MIAGVQQLHLVFPVSLSRHLRFIRVIRSANVFPRRGCVSLPCLPCPQGRPHNLAFSGLRTTLTDLRITLTDLRITLTKSDTLASVIRQVVGSSHSTPSNFLGAPY